MNKEETEKLILSIQNGEIEKPKMLLHACCGPCTSGVFDQLSPYFDITILYYNPNTYPKEEYLLRYEQLLILKKHYDFKLILCDYDEEEFLSKTRGFENEKEHGKRCPICFNIRMEKCAKFALENGFDMFTTTLSVSPYKPSKTLNEIGERLEEKYGIKYYYSDFKKKDGYKNSIKNSKEFGLYRQDYCGCRYSLKERQEYKENHKEVQNG